MRKSIAVLGLALALACTKGPESAAATEAAIGAAPQQVARTERMIVRSADVKIIVADTNKAVDLVTKNVESLGGYVAGSSVWRDGEVLRAKLTLRVPSGKLSPALASIRGIAKRVESETVTSEDVSEQYVDLAAQLKNLQATETELRELLTAVRQSSRKAGEVLEVHQRMTEIRGQIEQTQGRMRYLSQVAALSSIALDVTPDALAQPVVQPGWQPLAVAKDASRALVGVLQSMAGAAIWIVIYVLPILVMAAALMLAMAKAVRRMRRAAG